MENDVKSPGVKDPLLWKKKARAFVTRTHQHLWGKNNQDPMAFLFRRGLSLDFIRSMHLGWNKFGQERPFKNWGMDLDGSFVIPSGLVFPRIENKDLKSVYIIPMDGTGQIMLPGSDPSPMVLGGPEKSRVKETKDLLKGLARLQDAPQNTRIKILSQNPGIGKKDSGNGPVRNQSDKGP